MTMKRVLDFCSPANRTMRPMLVLLNLVPVWNIGFSFYSVVQVSNSLAKEFAARDLRPRGDFGKTVGILGLIAAIHVPMLAVGAEAINGPGESLQYWLVGASLAALLVASVLF